MKILKRFISLYFIINGLLCIFLQFGSVKFRPNSELVWEIGSVKNLKEYEGHIFLNFANIYLSSLNPNISTLTIVLKQHAQLDLFYVKEILNLIDLYKKNGKKIKIYSKSIYNINHFLIFSAGDERILEPNSEIWFEPYNLTYGFSKKKHEKDKTKIHVFRYGNYKFGPHIDSRDNFDFYAAYNYRTFLSLRLNFFKKTVMKNLRIDQNKINAILQSSCFLTHECLDNKFATKIDSFKKNILKNWLKDFMLRRVYVKNLNSYLSTFNYSSNCVYVIPLIFPMDTYLGWKYYLKRLKQNIPKNAKNILILIDCPGGYSTIGHMADEFIQELKQEGKYVIGFAKLAGSGGYLVASACDKIFGNSFSILGSIGTYLVIPVKKDEDITYDSISIYNEFSEDLTELQKAYLRKSIKLHGEEFFNSMKKRRKLLFKEIGNGQVFFGKEAKVLRLIDDIDGIAGLIEFLYLINKNQMFSFKYVW